MQALIRTLLLAAAVVVLIGCGQDKPPYEPGKGVTPPPPPEGAKVGQGMPNPGGK